MFTRTRHWCKNFCLSVFKQFLISITRGLSTDDLTTRQAVKVFLITNNTPQLTHVRSITEYCRLNYRPRYNQIIHVTEKVKISCALKLQFLIDTWRRQNVFDSDDKLTVKTASTLLVVIFNFSKGSDYCLHFTRSQVTSTNLVSDVASAVV